jgi:tellurite resistance protein TehA-like permease
MTIDSPEVAAGQPGTLSPLPTPTTTQTSVPGLSSYQAQFAKDNGHHSNKTAAIVGGVLGGIIFIVLTIVLMLWGQRIKRRKATRAAAAVIFGNHAVPLQEKVSKRNQDDLPPDVVSSAI